MAILFRYINILREDGTLRRAPYIPAWIRNKDNALEQFSALIDSGADSCVMPFDLAEYLGVQQQGVSEKTMGIGGTVGVKRAQVSLTIKSQRERYELLLPVLVAQNSELNIPFILGRNGFFENFHILFRQNELKISLKKVAPKYTRGHK